jgi:hypothetical protein
MTDEILNKIEQMVNIAREISEIDETMGDVFLMNLRNSMDIIETSIENKPIDISDKIILLAELLNLDLETYIEDIVKAKFSETQDGTLVSREEADKEVLDFIINNTKNIDDYEKFLKENSVKENLDYLKETL